MKWDSNKYVEFCGMDIPISKIILEFPDDNVKTVEYYSVDNTIPDGLKNLEQKLGKIAKMKLYFWTNNGYCRLIL